MGILKFSDTLSTGFYMEIWNRIMIGMKGVKYQHLVIRKVSYSYSKCAESFSGTMEIYFNFLLFVNSEIAYVVEILP